MAGARGGAAALLLASNRGPVTSASTSDGRLELRRGGGGLVSALEGRDAAAVWVCAALSDDDRRARREGRLPTGVHMLDVDPAVFEAAYHRVANAVLWPVHHLLEPDPLAEADWAAYEAVDEAFAQALAAQAAPGAAVLVQDYHLALVPRLLRARRPDLRISHFSHTPWATPEALDGLPVGRALLEGMLGADALGFLSPRWSAAFRDCCAALLGAQVEADAVLWQGRRVALGVHPLGVDAPALRRRAQQDDVQERAQALRALVRGCRTVLRVDRSEPTKGIVQGMQAFAALLRAHPEHRGRVVHLALAYPSRSALPAYRAYTRAVREAAAAVEEEFGTDDWRPVHLLVQDDHARSLAALALADVLLVNPLRDGMNLVAKEGPVLSREGLALVLSREAGAADELGDDALLVDPHDVQGTAEALHRALAVPAQERAERCRRLAAAAGALPPAAWLRSQEAALPPAPRVGG